MVQIASPVTLLGRVNDIVLSQHILISMSCFRISFLPGYEHFLIFFKDFTTVTGDKLIFWNFICAKDSFTNISHVFEIQSINWFIISIETFVWILLRAIFDATCPVSFSIFTSYYITISLFKITVAC